MKATTKQQILDAFAKGISEANHSELELLSDLRFEFEKYFSDLERIKRNNQVVTDMFKTIGNCFDPNKIKKGLDELSIKPK